ncbi:MULTISPECIES: LysM domain-containing protein [Parageobacillus]|uniref:LysM domain-containing protein n=1 Tax=Parageobacillus thermoglucosidasius TaxID=1426 RepID=A0A1B7KWV9_PARTM|nr:MULTISPECIES: LysM domain-containing protein [Parageobacillus]OAT74501.1 hypothetical protein A7K69_01965 [Parageobacillus thermoglucosidasius]BDG46503.1 hypothetical protein PspKH34_10640 [Parageobacillus sp. KH3-4]
MKKAITIFVICLSIYIIYHDVTTGTLSISMKTAAGPERAADGKKHVSIPYQTVTVNPGDTLLSIMERQQNGPLPVSIDKVIADFEALNPGEKAQTLQIGKKYKIPVYQR